MLDHLGLRKMVLRRKMRRLRAEAVRLSPQAGEAVASHFLSKIVLPPQALVSFYLPLKSEMDSLPLARALADRGFALALPCVSDAKGMLFRAYAFGDPVVKGAFDISEPLSSAPVVDPDVLLVPLLAFDGAGRRLGMGRGYYDRYLAAARARKDVCVIGLAYHRQRCSEIPDADHDERLNAVVTESGVEFFDKKLEG